MTDPVKPSTPWGWLLALLLAFGGGSYLGSDPCHPAPVVPAVDPVDPAPVPGPLSVEGKTACAPGEQVELKATGEASWVRWQTEAKYAGPYEGGRVIVFTSPVPGRFVFFLSGDVKGKGEGDEHVVTVGTPAPPVVVQPPDKPPVTPDPTVRANRATFVYEKTKHPIPSGVAVAADKLNRAGVVANLIDFDAINGKGQVPAQHAVALQAAKQAGLPCLVVEFTSGPPKVVANPKTEAQVMEACK